MTFVADSPSITTDFNHLQRDGAIISECGRWRYALHRRLPTAAPRKSCLFLMLNPSTADWRLNDPTIRRDIGFAIDWRCTDLFVGNLFAWRATDPRELEKNNVGDGDIVGPGNMDWVRAMVDVVLNREDEPGIIVAAWGAGGGYMDQDRTLMGWIPGAPVQCLGHTKEGHPKHPLYLKKTTPLEEFKCR